VKFSPVRIIWGGVTVLVLAAAGVAGYRFVRADLAAGVYRQRLQTLATDYERLRGNYNQAIRRTAVTELDVEDGRLTVRVRSAAGVLEELPTPYDPNGEIYVDYVVLDGRLWIRRVFDSRTPPGEGLVIDPDIASIDWDDEDVQHGKAVYRRLGEGRWVVTVTGQGSLGLARLPDGEQAELIEAPEIREYAEEADEADQAVRGIGPREVWAWVTGK